jgi:glycosyltransferase involved in cell wall biosynthesis
MRIALVTNLIPHYRKPLYEELGRRLDLTVFLTSRGREWYWQGGLKTEAEGFGFSACSTSSPIALSNQLRTGGFDAVIAGLTGRATLLSAYATTRWMGVPFVLWVGIWKHPHSLVHTLSRPVARELYRRADAILTYGSHVSDFVADESGRTERVFVAPQCVEGDRFSTEVSPARLERVRNAFGLQEGSTLLFVGRLTEEKGVDYLLQASELARTDHRLVVAGDGPVGAEARALVRALGVADRVIFAGPVAQRELPELMQACDALVLPSVTTRRSRETWGLVANEAMSAGLPVIATEAVGAAAGGLVIHGQTGLVVPERDAAALAAAIDKLLGSKALRRGMGAEAARQVMRLNFAAAADVFEAALAATVARTPAEVGAAA